MAELGIDLGTATIIIYMSGKGVVLNEPSAVAINKKTGEIIYVGQEAYDIIGKTNPKIEVIRPMSGGVIADYRVTEKLLKYFLVKVLGNKIIKPKVSLCIPSIVTGVERMSVIDAAIKAGARDVHLIEEPVAAAIGSGIDILKPRGVMIVDIGGGTTDVAVLSLGGVVQKTSTKIAGEKLNDDIIKYIKKEYNMLIGEKTAEEIKKEYADVFHYSEKKTIEVKGRFLTTGIADKVMISSADIYQAIIGSVSAIIDTIQFVLDKTPPELVGDVGEDGLTVTGGGALLKGIAELIKEKTGIEAHISENPTECVAIGTGMSYQFADKLYNGYFGNRKIH